MRTIISTWTYKDSKKEESLSPQVGANSSSKKFQETYWRCIAVFFETSVRYHPEAEHILFTNTTEIPVVHGFDIKSFLERLNVKLIQVPHQYPLPAGYYKCWRSQSFILSILHYLSAHMEEDDRMALLDSDCVFSKPIHEAFEKLEEHDALTYVIKYDEQHEFSDMNRLRMQEVFSALGLELENPPIYCGGEIVLANGKFVKAMTEVLPSFFEKLLERFKNNQSRLTEDGQWMTYFYYKFSACTCMGGLNAYIKRLWTNPYISRNIEEEHRELPIWHLPAEKNEGIRELYRMITKGTDFKKMPEETYQRILYDILLDDVKYSTFAKRMRYIRFNKTLNKVKEVYQQYTSNPEKELNSEK